MAEATPILRFLRLPQVRAATGLSSTRIWQLESRGEFPRRIKVSERATAWLEHEVQEFIAGRVAASRGGPEPLNRAPNPPPSTGPRPLRIPRE